jgi:transportin-3
MQVDIDQVKNALTTLYDIKATTSTQRRSANKWLEQYQKTVSFTFSDHQPQAWSISQELLLSQSSTTEQRLFAAQTFRQKIEYDLKDLTSEALIQL